MVTRNVGMNLDRSVSRCQDKITSRFPEKVAQLDLFHTLTTHLKKCATRFPSKIADRFLDRSVTLFLYKNAILVTGKIAELNTGR